MPNMGSGIFSLPSSRGGFPGQRTTFTKDPHRFGKPPRYQFCVPNETNDREESKFVGHPAASSEYLPDPPFLRALHLCFI